MPLSAFMTLVKANVSPDPWYTYKLQDAKALNLIYSVCHHLGDCWFAQEKQAAFISTLVSDTLGIDFNLKAFC